MNAISLNHTPAATGSYSLTLREIASWSSPFDQHNLAPIRAGIPALQRGLVWTPQQIEILWDSLLRGFPVGAFVVCPCIATQAKVQDSSITHHLLDGQQRCNAIGVGFSDPFAPDHKGVASSGSVLWLDLSPEIPANSTREFLVRVTTSSHPWGYDRSDSAWRLPAREIRESLRSFSPDTAQPNHRPAPGQIPPYCAKAPVPLAWLMDAGMDADASNEGEFWARIGQKLPDAPEWLKSADVFLSDQNPGACKQRNRIFQAVLRAHSLRVVALNAPDSLIEETLAERAGDGRVEDIASVEHLFQRLNQQGTRLDGEELAYSMIKAYWPVLAQPIEEMNTKRMPASRLVMLGVRAALARKNPPRFPASPSVSAVRKLASSGDEQSIFSFIASSLGPLCSWIDACLRYDGTTNPDGLPPVLLSSVARNSPDVYALLLVLADRLSQNQTGENVIEPWRKPFFSLATRLHWFSINQHEAVQQIYAALREDISPASIFTTLEKVTEAKMICRLPSPEELAAFTTPPISDFADWAWWKFIHIEGDLSGGNELRRALWEKFLDLRGNRELLLYAQRHFLCRRFPDYDPSRRDLWEDHNRPWDFDHILASVHVRNKKGHNKFQKFAYQWLNTIGNLRAVSFEENRSDSAELAASKITTPEQLADSFLLPQEVSGFSIPQVIDSESDASQFAKTCQTRMARIYAEWFKALS